MSNANLMLMLLVTVKSDQYPQQAPPYFPVWNKYDSSLAHSCMSLYIFDLEHPHTYNEVYNEVYNRRCL